MSKDTRGPRGGSRKAKSGAAARRIPAALPLLLVIAFLPAAWGCRPSMRGSGNMVSLMTEETTSAGDASVAAIDPLSGEVIDPGLLRRRVLAVKVENDPAARPQSGVADAEVVIEELVEGGTTRFICLYLAHESPVIGPVRSVRPTDFDLLHFLKPLLAFSGGAPQVMEMAKSSGIMFITEESTCFWRDRKRAKPHNLYTSTFRLREYLRKQGDESEGVAASGLSFREPSEDPNSGGEGGFARFIIPASTVDIPYENGCSVRYLYDPERDAYLRFVQGKPHNDKESGKQLAPRNVILQFVQLTSSGVRDVLGAESPNSMVIGSGRCAVFSGGEIMVGTWVKSSRAEPTRFYDLVGQEMMLDPGQTWIHLVPNNLKTSFMP